MADDSIWARKARGIEHAIEQSVAAGIAAQRASLEAGKLRSMQAEHRELTPAEEAHLAELEAESDRLSAIFVASQGPLHALGPSMFQRRLAEVRQRIKERVAGSK